MQTERPAPPWSFMTIGFVFAAFGCPAYFARESYDAPLWLGPLLLLAAVVFLSIGVISIGVSNGIARARSAPAHPRDASEEVPAPSR